jgi:hypothetical protein
MSGYTDRAGIDSRANSALGLIGDIAADVTIPAAVRLALVAEVMAGEPILTDRQSPAAFTVRAQADRDTYRERFGIVRARQS